MKLGFAHILTLLFVACKLFGVIDWSWWLVFTPLIVLLVIMTSAKFIDGATV